MEQKGKLRNRREKSSIDLDKMLTSVRRVLTLQSEFFSKAIENLDGDGVQDIMVMSDNAEGLRRLTSQSQSRDYPGFEMERERDCYATFVSFPSLPANSTAHTKVDSSQRGEKENRES